MVFCFIAFLLFCPLYYILFLTFKQRIMDFPKQIFKAYDIRGLVDGELTADLACRIGRAFVCILRERGCNLGGKSLVVGRDMRSSSLEFQRQVIKAIIDEGVNATDIGLATTPLFNFACANYPEYAGGIMVTASHNPAEYNGFKMTFADGLPLGRDTGMDDLRDLAEANDFLESDNKGVVGMFDPYPDYEAKIFSLINKSEIKPLKIIVDAGNGMAKVTVPKILANLPLTVEYLFLEPDGTFPNHEANPLKENTLVDLQAKVVAEGADLGFALDGDADRVGFVDEQGQIVPPSIVGALLGLQVLHLHPKAHMMYSLITSRIAKVVWEEQGATTSMTSVGHALVKKQMKEEKAQFAAELSLHMFYHDMYDLEVPELSLLYMLKAMNEKKLSEVWQVLASRFYHSGEINFKVANSQAVLTKLKEKFVDAEVQDFDGLLFTYPNWWFSIRLSNTEPLLRLNLEADTRELMEDKLKEVKNIITNQN